MAKFTDKYLKALKPGEVKQVIRESNGFAIRVSPAHARDGRFTVTFLFLYTWEGKQASMNLGQYGTVTLADARKAYNEAHGKVLKGIDPKAPEPVTVTPDEELTWGHFADLYIGWSKDNHSDAWHKTVKMSLDNDVTPHWKDRPMVGIRRREGIALMEAVAKRAPGQARNAYRAMRGVFSYAVGREYLDANPMLGLSEQVPALKPVARKRVLNEKELKHVWERLTNGPGDKRTRDAIKLVLVTLQRPGEVVSLHRKQLDGHWWTQQADKTKNEEMHLAYLSDLALELITEDEDGWIFPSPRLDENDQVRHLNRQALSQHIASHGYFGLDPWRPHDLRRTARTRLAKLGVREEVAEATMNHKKKGIVGVYNLHEYEDEKRAAGKLWQAELLRIVNS